MPEVTQLASFFCPEQFDIPDMLIIFYRWNLLKYQKEEIFDITIGFSIWKHSVV